MVPDRGILENKLRELEALHRHLSQELQNCQGLDRPALDRALIQLRRECARREQMLRRCAEGCRSPAIAALSQAQLSYSRRVRQILEQEMPLYLHSENTSMQEDRCESAALYAEYAVDFAALTARYALLAALMAMDAQMTCTEERRLSQ